MKNTFETVMKELADQRGINLDHMIEVEHPVYSANKITKTMEETELHQAFVVNANADGYMFGEDSRVERIIKAFFIATAAYLSRIKVAKIDEATALILTDVAGNFKFGAIVEYHENENPDEPGNWSLSLTFNEDDISIIETRKTVKKMLYTSPEFCAVIHNVGYDVAGVQFTHDSFVYDACILIIDTITQILDREAVENDVVDIELEGFFIASVEVEDGIKTFGIVPGGLMKEVIKDDTVLDSMEF